MARRVTWTNNSTDYDGTNIYRDTTIDPQNLPEPIATVDPVAQGATVEYIDLTGSGDQCYAVRDFDSSDNGALSEAYCFEETADWSQVSIGDEVEGGIYAGVLDYEDGRLFRIIMAKASGEAVDIQWGQDGVTVGSNHLFDGVANSDAIIAAGGGPAVDHCDGYTSDGYDDFYLPSVRELQFLYDNLNGHAELADNQSDNRYTYSSYETDSSNVYGHRMSDDNGTSFMSKTLSATRVRPIRRVAA